jgi:hypothetical protein
MFKPAPTEYPIPYHFCRDFVSLPRIYVVPPAIEEVESRILSKSPMLKSILLSGFQAVRPDLVGVLRGEYVVIPDGLLLLNRSGNWFSINTPLDNQLWAKVHFDKINTEGARDLRADTIRGWDDIPAADNTLVMSSIWSNYYHYTFDMIPKLRLAEQLGYNSVYVPEDLLARRYQQSLLARAVDKAPVVTAGMLRVRNPVLAECTQSRESLLWLREKMQISAPPGRRRLLVRRSQADRRIGDNISQTPEFMEVMARHGFETVDFGNGEKTIEQQIEMLSGAEVIVAPHGAGLTNLAYLNAPLTVIEVFSASVLSASFMQLSLHLGFRYYAVIEEHVAADANILVDAEQLDRILQDCLGRRKPAGRKRKPAAEPIAA